VSKYEAELRRRLAIDGADLYDTMCWFLTAINAQAVADGGPETEELSWFEREFLINNTEFYHKERCERMTNWELLNAMAAVVKPDQPRLDMSDWPDVKLINTIVDPDDCRSDSAIEELVKRANAKCITMADYIDVVLRKVGKGSIDG
jgi:hypothetical protein